MTDKVRPARNPFRLSLGGQRAISSFGLVPAVDHDRINAACDERCRRGRNDKPGPGEYPGIKGRYWLFGRRRTA